MVANTFKTIDYVIYISGRCITSHGGKGVCGHVLVNNHTGRVMTHAQAYKSTTTNRMVLISVITVLQKIGEGESALIYSDSDYLIDTQNGAIGKFKNLDLWNQIEKYSKKKSIQFELLRGYEGADYMEVCDRICNKILQTGPYIEDAGYKNFEKWSKKSEHIKGLTQIDVLNIPIAVSDETKHNPVSDYYQKYADDHHINVSCAQSIISFYSSDLRTLDSYMNLKTGGHDEWSPFGEDTLKKYIDQETWNLLEQYLNGYTVLLAARWICRGLKVSDAIRYAMLFESKYYSSN